VGAWREPWGEFKYENKSFPKQNILEMHIFFVLDINFFYGSSYLEGIFSVNPWLNLQTK
jgi:hypothetical protein